MIEYSGGSISGTAFVASDTINNAISYLKNNGYFNGTPQVYQVVRIQRITATDMEPCIVSEIYKNPAKIAEKVSKLKSCTPSVRTEIKYVRCPSEKPDKPEDNTMESIIENNTSKILYIDRIGFLKESLQPRNKGYLVMLAPSNYTYYNELRADLGNLYLWDGDKYIDLGKVKSKYIKEVRSATAVIDVVRMESQSFWNNSKMNYDTQSNSFQEQSWYNPIGKIRTGLFFTGRNSRVPILYRMMNNPSNYRRVIKEFVRDFDIFTRENPYILEKLDNGDFVKNHLYVPLLGISNFKELHDGSINAIFTVKFFIGTYNKNHRDSFKNKNKKEFNPFRGIFRPKRYQIKQIYKTLYVKLKYSQSSADAGRGMVSIYKVYLR